MQILYSTIPLKETLINYSGFRTWRLALFFQTVICLLPAFFLSFTGFRFLSALTLNLPQSPIKFSILVSQLTFDHWLSMMLLSAKPETDLSSSLNSINPKSISLSVIVLSVQPHRQFGTVSLTPYDLHLLLVLSNLNLKLTFSKPNSYLPPFPSPSDCPCLWFSFLILARKSLIIIIIIMLL